jgi:hypothetical protein
VAQVHTPLCSQNSFKNDQVAANSRPGGPNFLFLSAVVIFHLAIEGLLRLVSGGPWCKQSAIFAAVSKAGPDRQGEILLQLLYEKASNQYWNSTPLFAQERE